VPDPVQARDVNEGFALEFDRSDESRQPKDERQRQRDEREGGKRAAEDPVVLRSEPERDTHGGNDAEKQTDSL